MNARADVADFWDEVLDRWVRSPEDPGAHLVEPLPKWFASYKGTGKGAVDLSCYPDPYVGDLRGETHEVRLVVLGLNPGVGYPALQGHGGVWTERIQAQGYSHCLRRSPAEDPQLWRELHGSESPYWRNTIAFTRRWLGDDTADAHTILNLELYPWHSNAVVGKIAPPPDLLERFVWAPASEVSTPLIFAFGAPWFSLLEALDLPVAAAWGPGGEDFPDLADDKGWRMSVYRLPSGQLAVVSSQPGYSGPPGAQRLESMRAALADFLKATDGFLPEQSADCSAPPAPDKHDAHVVEEADHGPEQDWSRPSRPGDPLPFYWQRGLLALQTVSELHQRGYQQLRIVPSMSGSGHDWRCILVPASRVSGRGGFTIDADLAEHLDWEQEDDDRLRPPVVLWGPSDRHTIFGVADRDMTDAALIADGLAQRYPELLEASQGPDWPYAGWFLERIWDARNGFFPIAYDNWDYAADFSTELRMWGPAASNGRFTRPLPPPPSSPSR